jgi:pyruvate,water dikinase
MRWWRWLERDGDRGAEEALQAVRERFATFLSLLDANHRVLGLLADLEEKARGDYLFDIHYVRTTVSELARNVADVIDAMITLGGRPYAGLWDCYNAVDSELDSILSGPRPVQPGAFTLPLDRITGEQIGSVGSKLAQLGEMQSRLGLRVPDGFAITAWAYRRFIDSNDLQQRISGLIESLDIKRYEDLVAVSERIQEMVLSSPLPAELTAAIEGSFRDLERRSGATRFAVRSSAIGEDTHFSFAGQYSTFLNVRGDEILDRYRQVLASKFTPKAIYYLLSHSFRESDLAMSVGCMAMVDAAASGVTYTRDPLRPEDDELLINAVFGLGPYLVDGTLTPDLFRISRKDLRILERRIEPKPMRLDAAGKTGVAPVALAGPDRNQPSIDEASLASLARMALEVEEHYGLPQDIEWSLDRSGELFVLQTRPLRLMRSRPSVELPPVDRLETVLAGGTTVCPGAGCGKVFHARSPADLPTVPERCVLVAPHPFPGLIAVLAKAAALVTEVGGVASHMGTLVREYGIPTVMGMRGAAEIAAGSEVTVDANSSTLYAGCQPELVRARRADMELLKDAEIITLLNKVLALVSPLNLLHPADDNFNVASCRTFHDVIRFAHQKGVQEMFEGALALTKRHCPGLRLKSEIPLRMDVFFLDQAMPTLGGGLIDEDEIPSLPMHAFWSGVKQEGWPSGQRQTGFRRLVPAAADRSKFAQESCAFLGRDYMVMSLHMGYHFLTVEAMCTPEVSKNFVHMQYKHGGMWVDRRLRRVRLITEILDRVGFDNASKGDFLDSRISYLDSRAVQDKLHMLGRLAILTKQLDMALANDEVTRWYTQDILEKLGIAERDGDGA